MPVALVRTSPLEYPTATAEPGCSVCGGKLPSGPGGTASTGRPAFAAAFVSAFASGAFSPLTESGAAIGFALRDRRLHPRRRRPRSARRPGVPRIASIDVASATLPPYSLTDCEIAPITR